MSEADDEYQQEIRWLQRKIDSSVEMLKAPHRREEVISAYIAVRKQMKMRGIEVMWGDDAHEAFIDSEIEEGAAFDFSESRRVPDTVILPRKDAPISSLPTRHPAVRLALLLEQFGNCLIASEMRVGGAIRARNAGQAARYAAADWRHRHLQTKYGAKKYANIKLFLLWVGQPLQLLSGPP